MSALSNKRILQEMKDGNILIHPFNKKNLATSSFDVTLGEFYYREQAPKPTHALYNIWDKTHVEQVWGASQVQKALKATKAFEKLTIEWNGISPNDKVILLRPGEMILGHTNEFIGGMNHITTMMKARSSMGRNFINVCKCAGWGDVGYVNRWTMEITNSSSHYTIPLVVGRRIAQIVFLETGPILENDQNYTATGKYASSQNLKELRKNWKPSDMLPKLYLDRDIEK